MMTPQAPVPADVLPSRELNALIAEHVFRHDVRRKRLRDGFVGFDAVDVTGRAKPVPPYSTEVGAAWKVVERLAVKQTHGEHVAEQFQLLVAGDEPPFDDCDLTTLDGRSLAWRICVAALEALNIPEAARFAALLP